VIAERLRQDGAELEAAETCTEDNDSSFMPFSVLRLGGLDYSVTIILDSLEGRKAPRKPTRRTEVYLQITLKVAPANRPAAAGVYQRYKAPFLTTIAGAKSKELLVRDDDVQVLHGFDTAEQANAYLKTGLFTSDVVGALKPLLDAAPDVRIYKAA
jgi:hypothetical protein